MTTVRDLARLRLAAQRLAGERCPTALEAVSWMTCSQAQDLPGALRSVALRTRDGTTAGVHAALDAGTVVRSWPMRGTLHVVAAEDLRWMLSLTTERLMAGARRRREQLGIDDDIQERARAAAVDLLQGGGEATRAQLLAVWEDAGLLGVPQRGYHLIWALAQTGTLCWGPTRGGREQRLVLLDEWAPAGSLPGRDAALAEWALRYFRSHGPATVHDFAWWTGLRVSDARAGLAAVADRLDDLTAGGTTYYLDPDTPKRLAAARDAGRVRLLPGFDELVLGYQDRSAVLPAEHADRVVPGGNGMFRGTVVDGGRAVGTWRPLRATGVDPTPFTSFSARVERDLPKVYAELP